MTNKNLDAAEAAFKRALELRSSYGDAYFQLGVVLAYKGDFVQSVIALSEALKLKSERKDVLCALGMVRQPGGGGDAGGGGGGGGGLTLPDAVG
jgi:Flp pilus assembly protein TadD